MKYDPTLLELRIAAVDSNGLLALDAARKLYEESTRNAEVTRLYAEVRQSIERLADAAKAELVVWAEA